MPFYQVGVFGWCREKGFGCRGWCKCQGKGARVAAVRGGSAGGDCQEGELGAKGTEEARKLRVLVAFLLGLGVGPEGQAVVPQLPGGVFVLVMNTLMPRWEPLRKGLRGLE